MGDLINGTKVIKEDYLKIFFPIKTILTLHWPNSMKYYPFANGDTLPALGLGTWKSEKGKVYQAIKDAIKIGYRHFDCAPIYGNEVEIGHAFKEGIVR